MDLCISKYSFLMSVPLYHVLDDLQPLTSMITVASICKKVVFWKVWPHVGLHQIVVWPDIKFLAGYPAGLQIFGQISGFMTLS